MVPPSSEKFITETGLLLYNMRRPGELERLRYRCIIFSYDKHTHFQLFTTIVRYEGITGDCFEKCSPLKLIYFTLFVLE